MVARKAGKGSLTVVETPTTELPNKEEKIMEKKEELKAQVADLKAKEKALREEIKAARAEEKARKAAAKAAGSSTVYSRVDALTDFLKSITGPVTMEEIIKGSNALYFQKKASEKANNEKEARSTAGKAVHALVNVGYLVTAEGKFTRA